MAALTLATAALGAGPQRNHLIIAYTYAISGELEPCGCTTGPLGGFAYRAPVLASVQGEGPASLILDAGDLLLKEGLSAGEASVGDPRRAKLLLDLLERQGARALAVGGSDVAALGVDGLRALARGRSLKLLSVNLQDASGARVFDGSAVFDLGGYRVGVIGVTGSSSDLPMVNDALNLGDPIESVEKEAAGLQGRVDLLLALSNLKALENEALAAAVPSLDFVLSGPQDRVTDSGAGLYDADGEPPFLTSLTSQGRYVGRLDVIMAERRGARPQPAPELGAALRKERVAREGLADLEARILEEEGAPNPERSAQQGALLQAQINKALASRAAPRERPGFYYSALPVTGGAGEDATTAALIKAFNEDEQRRLAVKAEAYASTVAFAGNNSCRGCHPLQTAQWLGTGHARALDSLVRLGKQDDPSCIGCHTTGWQQAGGFFTPERVAGHENVGCESCHGPMSDHPQRRRFVTPTSRATCTKCHDALNSPNFDYVAQRPAVTCPAGVVSPGGLVGETH